jgi:hypothetical protein
MGRLSTPQRTGQASSVWRTLRFATLLAIATVAIVSRAQAADPVFPAGSRIGLVPPAGMVASDVDQGFADPSNHALIVVSEHSAGVFTKIEKELAIAQLRADGFEVEAHEPVAQNGAHGFLVVARQTVGGVPIRKWALVLAADITAVVIGIVPEAATATYSDAAMRAALASVTIRARLPAEDLLAVLPFRIDDLAGFRLLQANPKGLAVLTLGADDTTQPAAQPYFSVMTWIEEMAAPAEQDAVARRMLAPFMNPARFHVLRAQPLRIGGQQGHEIVGEMKDSENGAELTAVQWVRFGVTRHLQMLGVARTDQWPTVFPRMRAIRDGIEPK